MMSLFIFLFFSGNVLRKASFGGVSSWFLRWLQEIDLNLLVDSPFQCVEPSLSLLSQSQSTRISRVPFASRTPLKKMSISSSPHSSSTWCIALTVFFIKWSLTRWRWRLFRLQVKLKLKRPSSVQIRPPTKLRKKILGWIGRNSNQPDQTRPGRVLVGGRCRP